MYRAEPVEKQGAHNSHATAAENGANHGFLGVRQSADSFYHHRPYCRMNSCTQMAHRVVAQCPVGAGTFPSPPTSPFLDNFRVADDSGVNDDEPSSVPIRAVRLSMDGGPAELNSLYGSMTRSALFSLLAERRIRGSEDTQAAFADGLNVAAFFLTNPCTVSGSCPVSVRTSSDVRSKRPARCRSANAARWFTT